MDRRGFLVAAAMAATAGTAAEVTPASSTSAGHGSSDAIEELSLADIAAAFAEGRLSSQQLTQSYLTRIEQLDRAVQPDDSACLQRSRTSSQRCMPLAM